MNILGGRPRFQQLQQARQGTSVQPSHPLHSPASSIIDLISDDEEDRGDVRQITNAEPGPSQQSLPEATCAGLPASQQPQPVPCGEENVGGPSAHSGCQQPSPDAASCVSIASPLPEPIPLDTSATRPSASIQLSVDQQMASQPHAHAELSDRTAKRIQTVQHDTCSIPHAAGRVEVGHPAAGKPPRQHAMVSEKAPGHLSAGHSSPDLLSQLRAQALARHAAARTLQGQRS